jgi:nicotinate-nucleotide pyrophosphorylase (carboxylating)
MLDNFTPTQAHKTIKALRAKEKIIGKKIIIELSGGITLRNLRHYSKLGADLISMGSLTQNARSIDFSLDFIVFEGVK